jgi:hypothetical protein
MTVREQNIGQEKIERGENTLEGFLSAARQLLIHILVSSILTATASSALALEITYGGRLATASGEPVTGTVSIIFRLYREASGGAALVTVTPPDVTLVDGLFQSAIPLTAVEADLVFGDGDESVYVEVESQGKTYPRQKFSYVPLALRVPVDGSKIVYDNEGRLTLGSGANLSTGTLSGATGMGVVEKVGEESYSTFAISNAGKALVGASDAASQRAILGLGSLGTRNSLSLSDMSGISCPVGSILRRDNLAWICEALSPSLLNPTVSQTEFDYLDGLTGAIQTQLNGKLSAADGTVTGTMTVGTGKELRFGSTNTSNFVGFKAPANMPTSNVYTLPGAFGTNGQVLSSDANGVLSWTSIPVTSVNGQSGSVSLNTDHINETATRKYFSQSLARQSISTTGLLSYNSSTGILSLSDTLLTKSGGTMTGSLDFGGNLNVTNLADPVSAGDAAKKSYVDGKLGGQPLVIGTPSPGQVVKWDGSKFALASDELGQPGGGIASLNTLTSGSQSLAVETPGVITGTRPNWTADSGTSTHRLTIPMASTGGVTAGLIAKSDYDVFSAKQDAITPSTTLNTGTVASNMQNGLQLKPYGTEASQTGELRFQELSANGAQYIGLKAPDALTASTVWTLPSSDGTGGYVLSTNGSGGLSWISPSSGSVTSITTGTGLVGGPINGIGTISLANVGTAGTYTKVTTNAQGQVTSGSTLVESDIPSLSAGKITSGSVSVALGGTGATSFTNNGILVGSGASPLSATAAGTQYQVLRAGVGGAPAFGSINLDQSAAVTGLLPLANGGTGAATAAAARTSLGAAASGANSDITSLAGLTTPLSVAQGGTGAVTGAANTFFAAPNGASGAPSFRTLVAGDIPSLDAGKITSGTLSNTLINWASPGAIGAATSSSGAFTTLTTSGNVGIGTTAPSATLHVNGSSLIGSAAANLTNVSLNSGGPVGTRNLSIYYSSGGTNGSIVGDYSLIQSGYGGIGYSPIALNPIGGNVGIGTTSPTSPLEVWGGTSSTGNSKAIQIDFPASGTAGDVTRSIFSTWKIHQPAYVGSRIDLGLTNTAAMTSPFIALRTSPTEPTPSNADVTVERMRITSSGNVGIGTTAPNSNVQVGTQAAAATTTPTALSLGGSYSSAAGTNMKLKIYDDGNSSNLYGLGVSANQLEYQVPTGNRQAWFVGGSEKMRLDGNGNLGIGTTMPTKTLDVIGTIRSSYIVKNQYTITPAGSYDGTSRTWVRLGFQGGNAGGTMPRIRVGRNIWANDNTPWAGPNLTLQPYTASEWHGNTGGWVANYAEHTNGGTAQFISKLALLDESANAFGVYMYMLRGIEYMVDLDGGSCDVLSLNENASAPSVSTDIGFGVTFGNGSNSQFFVANTGNVGIGTTSPASKLEVNGKIKSTNYGRSASNPAISCEDILQQGNSNGNGRYWIDPRGTGTAFEVYCDMVTDGGGWTIVFAATGADGEQPMVSDVAVNGDPLSFQAHNLIRQQKVAVSLVSRESILIRNNSTWLKFNNALFDHSLLTSNRHRHYHVTISSSSGTDTQGYAGWSNYNISGGGDYAVTNASGIDHHSATYLHLNSGCGGNYFYSYSSAVADGDAGYDSNLALGDWAVTGSCSTAEGGSLIFYAAMR